MVYGIYFSDSSSKYENKRFYFRNSLSNVKLTDIFSPLLNFYTCKKVTCCLNCPVFGGRGRPWSVTLTY